MAPGHPFSTAKWSRRHSDVDTGPWHGRRCLAWPKRAVALRIPRPTRPGHGGIEHSPIRPCQSLRGRSKWLPGIPLAWPSGRVDIPMSVRGRGTAVDACRRSARSNRSQPNPPVQKSTRLLKMAPGHLFGSAKGSRRYSDFDTGPWPDRRRLTALGTVKSVPAQSALAKVYAATPYSSGASLLLGQRVA